MGALIGILGLALACGDAEPSRRAPSQVPKKPVARVQTAPGGGAAAPVLERVDIQPSRPLPSTRVTALVQARDADGDAVRYQYVWKLNGRQIGDQESVVLTGAVKGDRLDLEVIGSDGTHRTAPGTASATVANSPPRLYTVALEAPEGVRVGKTLVATPDAQDPDDDRLTYRYEWRVNGERRGDDSASFSLEGLRRGDEVVAVAWAEDGEDVSDQRASLPVTIGNAPPVIVSAAQWQRDGDTFRYDVKAEDPDGDRTLRYKLVQAPDGMRIDALGGRVTWTPRQSQVGKHRVEIEVDDLQGGKALQSVTVDIDLVEDDQPQAPAARAY